MGIGNISKYLIQHCSPTLAGMKTAGLFVYHFNNELAIYNSLSLTNVMLNPKGIYVKVLRVRNNNALIFVYHRSMLYANLEKPDVRGFLKSHGYGTTDINGYITVLKLRLLNNQEFPHEIGLFLGYPLHDVYGFILHNGQNSKCSGYWKVYCDEKETKRLFAKYSKCRKVYSRQFLQGKPIERLIVAA